MTTDELRRLLELAARAMEATGDKVLFRHLGGIFYHVGGAKFKRWSPDKYDGQNSRMRSALGINAEWSRGFTCSPTSVQFNPTSVACWAPRVEMHREQLKDHNGDRNAALRLCALRVAAEIGRGMV